MSAWSARVEAADGLSGDDDVRVEAATEDEARALALADWPGGVVVSIEPAPE